MLKKVDLDATVIGVHATGTDPDGVQEAIERHGIDHKVVLDKPSGEGFGKVTSQYGIAALPHTVLVDKEGHVVGHGSLDEMIKKLRQLASAEMEQYSW